MTRNSRVCSPESRLTLTNVMIGDMKCKIPLGLIVAILMALLIFFLFRRTTLGCEIRAVGLGRHCAEYAGIQVGRTVLISMGISGALAGLAGVIYYLGYTNAIIPKNLPSMGYDAISVALLGNGSPIGAIFAAMIVTLFQQGANLMSATQGVAREISSLITGILLLFASCGTFMKFQAARKIQMEAVLHKKENETAEKGGKANGKEAKA